MQFILKMDFGLRIKKSVKPPVCFIVLLFQIPLISQTIFSIKI